MKLKKIMIISAACFIFATIPNITANAEEVQLFCSVENCNINGYHQHNGISFATSNCYATCNLEDCSQYGTHEHNGIIYGTCLQKQECTVEGCTNTQNHVHDYQICEGHELKDGHGQQAVTSTTKSTLSNHKHHTSDSKGHHSHK